MPRKVQESTKKTESIKVTQDTSVSKENSVKLPVVNTPVDKPGEKIKTSTISINNLALEKDQTELSELKKRDQEFSDETLLQAWSSFIEEIPEQVHLCNTMKNCIPKLKDKNIFEVEVSNTFQEKELQTIQPKLISYIGNKLFNDYIEIKISVNQEKEEPEQVMLDKDKFDYLANKNEHLRKLASELGLEIV